MPRTPSAALVRSRLRLRRAQVKGIPFLAFDAGGVLELFDHHQYPDNIVWDPTAEGLSQRIAEARGPC